MRKTSSCKKKHGDLTDELLMKNKEIQELENENKNKSLQNSVSSLSEELQNVKVIECEKCSLTYANLAGLKEHKKAAHEEKLNLKTVF